MLRRKIINKIKKIRKKFFSKDDIAVIEELSMESGADSSWYREYMYANLPRVSADAKRIRQNLDHGDNILDVGALPPLLAAILVRDSSCRVTVIDPYTENFSGYFDRNQIDYIRGDILQVDLPELKDRFDIVSMCEVIEHLSGDLLSSLESIISYVKPGGLLYVTTPNLRSVSGFFALLIYRSGLASKMAQSVLDQYKSKTDSGYYGHVREYTSQEVIQLFEGLGMSLKSVHGQADYRLHPRSLVLGCLEMLFPSLRLFTKFVFLKPYRAGTGHGL